MFASPAISESLQRFTTIRGSHFMQLYLDSSECCLPQVEMLLKQPANFSLPYLHYLSFILLTMSLISFPYSCSPHARYPWVSMIISFHFASGIYNLCLLLLPRTRRCDVYGLELKEGKLTTAPPSGGGRQTQSWGPRVHWYKVDSSAPEQKGSRVP